MIKLLGKIPDKIYVACSGGVDSMAALSFLNNKKRDVAVAHFDHGTEHGIRAQKSQRTVHLSKMIRRGSYNEAVRREQNEHS